MTDRIRVSRLWDPTHAQALTYAQKIARQA